MPLAFVKLPMVPTRKSAYGQKMLAWWDDLRPRTGKRRRIATAILVAYIGLVIQPCAMAMGGEPAQHPTSCHDVPNDVDILLCLSEPVAGCGIEDWNVDARDVRVPDLDRSAALVITVVPVYVDTDRPEDSYFLLRAPPSSEPALHIQNCVFLK